MDSSQHNNNNNYRDIGGGFPATTQNKEYSIDLSKNNASSIRHIAREEAKVKGASLQQMSVIRDQS